MDTILRNARIADGHDAPFSMPKIIAGASTIFTLLIVACNCGPNDAAVESRYQQISERFTPLIFQAGLSSDPKCLDAGVKFLEQIDTNQLQVLLDDDVSNRKRMRVLDDLERSTDRFEENLAKAGCL